MVPRPELIDDDAPEWTERDNSEAKSASDLLESLQSKILSRSRQCFEKAEF